MQLILSFMISLPSNEMIYIEDLIPIFIYIIQRIVVMHSYLSLTADNDAPTKSEQIYFP